MFEDKYSFTQDQNRRFAKMNLTRLVFTNSRFEGVNTTLPQTQTIIDGLGVDGVPIDDINVIVQLKRAWQYIINEDRPVSLRVMKNINSVVAKMDSLAPGELRNGSGFVATLRGDFVPPDVDEQAEEKYLKELLENKDKSATEKSIELMYHLMRNQIFWDGNKRTATLIANKYMIDNGAGLINIPLDYWDEWNKLISEYYYDNDMSKIKEWTYKVGIQGIDSYRNISQDRENFVNLTKRKSKER
ncbi:Fic family protein [Ligilactobacillus salivarius]|uniref:Fic family protein n=1 Tax=Ligilactobacillus salivarius TaxID=1624 RepID=UPI00136E79F5|nr:Fic family protein [Ligilactobacillus salivarius]MYU69968.1 Fic family protein [Ligilactobacillus salivarius]MYZ81000.1 Fic family protein [Ligilactobacillus salivarius]